MLQMYTKLSFLSFSLIAPSLVILRMGQTLAFSASSPVSRSSSIGTSTRATAATTADTLTKDCVIVGGGPIGLACALTLSRDPHGYRVTVLEQTVNDTTHGENSSVRQYDPSRSYLYNINQRGLTWFHLPGNEYALSELVELGYAAGEVSETQICRIPADPKEPILPPQGVKVANVVSPMGRNNSKKTTSYWIPRHETVDLLVRSCEEQNQKLTNGGSITVLANKRVSALNANDPNGLLKVQCEDGTSVTASLVVAADGIDSTVRSILSDNTPKFSHDHWLQSKAKKFRIRKYKSPSTGLKIKTLQFPPNFTLTNTTGEIIPTIPNCFYSFRGANKGSRNRLNIGMLPLKRVVTARSGNIIAPYDHDIWKLQSGKETKEWIEKCFPRVDWNEMIEDKEWERFVNAKATTFPYCQYSPGSSITSPGGNSGVVLVGDACHAFPPDVGQGINAGLMDVVTLDDALQGKLNKKESEPQITLKDSLQAYENNRGPEHQALIRLARVGAPFQVR